MVPPNGRKSSRTKTSVSIAPEVGIGRITVGVAAHTLTINNDITHQFVINKTRVHQRRVKWH